MRHNLRNRESCDKQDTFAGARSHPIKLRALGAIRDLPSSILAPNGAFVLALTRWNWRWMVLVGWERHVGCIRLLNDVIFQGAFLLCYLTSQFV